MYFMMREQGRQRCMKELSSLTQGPESLRLCICKQQLTCQFVGHGISKERVEHAFELGKKWFQLSNEEKSQYKLDLTEYVGWKGERLLLNSDGKFQLLIDTCLQDSTSRIQLRFKCKRISN